MSGVTERIARLSPAKRALLALELGNQSEPEPAGADPIAIIGLGCRLPGGVSDTDGFWRLLHTGADGITEVPADRWDIDHYYDPDPDAPGKMSTRWGGFVNCIDYFDTRFFGISPREAARMDPQQRLLLEVSWEALEAAGQAPDRLVGSDTGVFLGISTNDYAMLQLKHGAIKLIDAYVGTGSAASVASGRLSYLLGLQGPCISVDTACSSSLVAVHLACQSLRTGECQLALAGGVNVILSPEITINFSKARMMAADGRCKTFDAAADGYVRGEGCGMIVLKRYADAVANGDDILAVIPGSAVNQDGRSGGLTVPNGPAQESVIRRALKNAGIKPSEVSYIEAHGTGTSLGDPIEIGALGAVFGSGRNGHGRLRVGSVKTNIGHLEAAAGIAGLIKVVLALRRAEIPPHLHLRELNPHIAAMGLSLEVPTKSTPWSSAGDRRVAGVSAFGFSGTNAHVLVAEAPIRAAAPPQRDRPLHLLCLSAKTEKALEQTASRLQAYLEEHPELSIGNVGFTANTGRGHFAHRATVVADSIGSLCTGLADVGSRAPIVKPGEKGRDKIAFLFTGQGSQYAGMGLQLFETQPMFRKTFARCDAILRPILGQSLVSLLEATPAAGAKLQRASFAQPLLFAFEYALSELWRSWGVEPFAVLGHGAGEYAAACVAGVFELEAGLKLAAGLGQLMEAARGRGTMAVVFAGEAVVATALKTCPAGISIAAVNGPRQVVISGYGDAMAEVFRRLRKDRIKCHAFEGSHAFHSPLMEDLLDSFDGLTRQLTCKPANVALVSSLTGRPFGRNEILDAGYWRRQLREPVRFADGVAELDRMGCGVLVEIGPRPILLPLAKRCLPRTPTLLLPSLSYGRDDWSVLLTSLSALYRSGRDLDWAGFDQDYSRRRCQLPTYPWQRERHWVDDMVEAATKKEAEVLADPVSEYPQLRRQLEVADASVGKIWTGTAPGSVLSSGIAIELVATAAAEHFSGEEWTLEEIIFVPPAHEPAVSEPSVLQVILTPASAGEMAFRLFQRPANTTGQESPWTQVASGRIRSGQAPAAGKRQPSSALQCGLMFFASSEDAGTGDRYKLVIESARYADRHGFSSVWVPERHFGQWGCLYPSPSVLHAALARETKRLRLRAGSVVMPLHHPLRVAEEWSMVDHLSGGRVDLSFASGWNPADFALAPGNYTERHEAVFTGIETVKKLWRGETIPVIGGDGKEVSVRTYPSPLQKEAGIWVTAAGNPQTFIRAGQIGANILTHLLDQGVEELGAKIKLYREARQSHGHDPATGQVSMMLHTFVGADLNAVKEQVRQPFCTYLKSISHLLAGLAQSRGRNLDVAKLSPADLDEFVNFLYERFFSTRAFLGTPESCRTLIGQLSEIGVNEVACLLDFGPTTGEILANLPHLNRLKELCAEAGAKPRQKIREAVVPPPANIPAIQARCPQTWTGETFYETLAGHGVQCTQSFRAIEELWLGSGEALGRMASAQALHPGFMDACFQVFAAAGLGDLSGDALYLPKKLGRFQLVAGAGPAAWSHATVTAKDATSLTGTVRILDANGHLVAEATGLGLERAAVPKSTLDPWLYELSWEEAKLTAKAKPGRWLIFADQTGVGESLAAILKSKGEEYTQVDPGQVANEPAAIRHAIEKHPGLTGVIHLWGLDAKPFDTLTPASLLAEQQQGAGSALWIMQALASTRTRLWLVTQGAQAVHGETQLSVSQSPLWGLGRTCAMEHPEIWGGLLDLDPTAAAADNARQILEVINNQEGEDQVALRGNRRYVARLVHTAKGPAQTLSIKADAGYLITGGLWGLGLEVARWLAKKGARHLWLMGRSELPPRAQWPQLAGESRPARQVSGLLELEKLGVSVHYVPLDIADETAVRRWYLEKGPVSVRGVIHAASVWQDATGQTLVRPLLSLDGSAMEAVFAPKVTGSFVLHQVLAKTELDFFVSFSSGASLVGSAGQGNYAAASAFLDALSQHRRLQGAPALSLNLGAVSQIGFGGTPEGRRVHEYWERHGIRRISPSDVLAALDQFVPQARAQIGVMHTDWPLLARSYPRLASLPWASKLISNKSKPGVTARSSAGGSGEILGKIATAAEDQRPEIVSQHLCANVASVLGMPASEIDHEQPLTNLGFDSLMALDLKSRVEADFGVVLPPARLLESPTIESLSEGILEMLGGHETKSAAVGAKAGSNWDEGEL